MYFNVNLKNNSVNYSKLESNQVSKCKQVGKDRESIPQVRSSEVILTS